MVDIQVSVAGPAGAGIKLTEEVLKNIFKATDFHFFAYREYMSRVRGGSNSTLFRLSERSIRAVREKIDVLAVLDVQAFRRLAGQMNEDGIVLADSSMELSDKCEINIHRKPFLAEASKSGSDKYINSVITGYLCSLLGISYDISEYGIERAMEGRAPDVIEGNKVALMRGMNLFTGDPLCKERKRGEKRYVCSGSEAVFTGAVSGGCSMISAYPMSPSTNVLVLGSQYGAQSGITTEQAEDEIAAVNMALGHWYGGGRALVTTSGGGLALMGEAVSLSGMTETPLVIHDAQRPGPATGLPTRTAQEDLNMVLNIGHGEFPRIVYAPGNMESLIYLTAKAFDQADRYQIPVFLLTDQYILNSYYDFSSVELFNAENKYIHKTKEGYERYRNTENGISPRGIPGWGDSCFTITGNMHDEKGDITESPEIAKMMTEKRLRKARAIIGESEKPLCFDNDRRNIVVTWGSNLHVVHEAISNTEWGHIHFDQVYPLDTVYIKQLFHNKRIAVIENNATGQFAALLSAIIKREDITSILKYDGRPFDVESVRKKMEEIS